VKHRESPPGGTVLQVQGSAGALLERPYLTVEFNFFNLQRRAFRQSVPHRVDRCFPDLFVPTRIHDKDTQLARFTEKHPAAEGGSLYVACQGPVARPNGMGVYRFDGPQAQPVFFAAMDDNIGRQPKDLETGPDGKLWMWAQWWGMLRWPVGGDTAGFEMRISDASSGGLDFGSDGNVYGCVDHSNSNFGYYTLHGAKLSTLFSDNLAAFSNMDFGPDRNGNGSCDIYIVEFYTRLGIYDGDTGAHLGDLFNGHPLKSVTGIVIPKAAPGSSLILR